MGPSHLAIHLHVPPTHPLNYQYFFTTQNSKTFKQEIVSNGPLAKWQLKVDELHIMYRVSLEFPINNPKGGIQCTLYIMCMDGLYIIFILDSYALFYMYVERITSAAYNISLFE